MTTPQSTFDLERYRRLIAEHDELIQRYNPRPAAQTTSIFLFATFASIAIGGLLSFVDWLYEDSTTVLWRALTITSILGLVALICRGVAQIQHRILKDRGIDTIFPEMSDMIVAYLVERYGVKNVNIPTDRVENWHRTFAAKDQYSMIVPSIKIMDANYRIYRFDLRPIDGNPTLINGEIDPETLRDRSSFPNPETKTSP